MVLLDEVVRLETFHKGTKGLLTHRHAVNLGRRDERNQGMGKPIIDDELWNESNPFCRSQMSRYITYRHHVGRTTLIGLISIAQAVASSGAGRCERADCQRHYRK